eukprot:jgi/Galph1/985/GphlegSOOS_G5906.1
MSFLQRLQSTLLSSRSTKKEEPKLVTYPIPLKECGPMVLDALFKIKNEVDTTFAFRRLVEKWICQIFIAQHRAVKPWLIRSTPEGGREGLQSKESRLKLDGLYECILCASCSRACPSYCRDEGTMERPSS